jgi:hypothetical protein
MPDLAGDGFNLPNPFGLLASDFGHDVDAYRVALGYLADLAGGSVESNALQANGGNPAMLRSWESSGKFRRVLAKCRAAGREEAAAAVRRAEEKQSEPLKPGEVRFVRLEDMPLQRESAFSMRATPGLLP